MTEAVIREVTEEDLPALIEISRETFADTFGADNSDEDMEKFLDESYSKEKLGGELANPGSTFYFLLADGQVAGYLKINTGDAQSEDVDPNGLEIERIYLRRSFQHKGLGSRLFDFAEEKARELDKSVLWLGVWEHNENAKSFYAHHGLTRFSEHVFVVGDDRQTDYLMKKSL
ncbi:N-acetyltransferase [Lactobacillus nasalidis]|uniref:N-acetyltransferase n=1 Tax=Lactobacillus nasalidis TaxID=2797258 RepID=A0ABQ3W5N1_9LACO|nr:GNAT family N-acetyltransferase [Lactobacillus nasalidis]GHV97916.1 N-acetyltransferase [Lactobacillus nasalidis]GHV99256.1 N-acetyltransferase [Lactobacillus nasalidis]GHW00399.1 N-acetyltransferase [Lactobacillus nasalidis]